MKQKQKQKLHERLGLSVEEALERMLVIGKIMHSYEKEHGEKLNLRYLEAVLHANTAPKKGSGV